MNFFKSVRPGRVLGRRFHGFFDVWHGDSISAGTHAPDERRNSLKSASQGRATFHRFQEIRGLRFTLSTAGLYDLYTRYGQSVDKKACFASLEIYPQLPPQPQGLLYRGFQVYKDVLNQRHKPIFHQIWPYHHHHALDLYPDLKAWTAPNGQLLGLWTVQSAEASSPVIPAGRVTSDADEDH
ncbi:TPA: hypothetical protein QDZ34_002615 [Stenotrophomonas maltophilia]|nr:hypothetical protein [Stenotrophomonas maltophilia]HDS1026427.1 hypothetical protein [Stenotrophomonas maltophilia]HDS1030654.1 hypothetical protein [Stenotrophomonas maltophilia]HDS1035253.1 hypothetical protein [Stenotrophomonas maltophilia]